MKYSTRSSIRQHQHINFTYESNFRYMNVWFDKEKMESIFKNIISNALKYTPEMEMYRFSFQKHLTHGAWKYRDTGIGIPANEQKKLFKLHFRGSNAINSKVTGSGYRTDACMEARPPA